MTPRWSHLFVLVAILLAFAVGRFSARAPDVEHQEHVEEIVKVDEKLEEKKEEVVTEEIAEERIRIVYRDRWRSPEGEERETEIEIDAEAAKSLLDKTKIETRVEIVEVEVVREVEVLRELRTPLPDWRVGGLVGIDLGELSPAYGLTIERRILGPVFVGAWGLSSGQGGLSVGVSF